MARHHARQLPAGTQARTVVPLAPGHRRQHQLRRPHRRQPRRTDRLGAPVPLRFAQVRTARFNDDLGFCPECEVPYCHQHWHPTDTGYGYCPYEHGKDLDLH